MKVLDYDVISNHASGKYPACADRVYIIDNAQEVLMWMYNNSEFSAY